MSPQPNEQELQQKLLELRILQETINQMGRQKEVVAQQITDLTVVSEGLEQLKSVKRGTKMKAQFAPNLFIDASFEAQGTVLMNVGANIFLSKSIDDAKTTVDGQKMELMSIIEKIDDNMNKLTNQFMVLQQSFS